MWQQLLLTPVSSLSSSKDAAADFTITTRLAHAESAPAPSRQSHKLGIDIPYYDARPPTGVLDVPCKAVHLKLLLSKQPRWRKRERQNTEAADLSLAAGMSDRDDTGSSQHLSHNDNFLDIFEDECALLHDRDPFAEQEESHVLDQDDESEYELLEFTLPPTDEPPELFNQASEKSKYTSHASPSREPAAKSRADCPDVDEFLRAIDAALKVAIAGPSRCSVNGFSAKACCIYPLSAVAPAIWSPGYLPSVAKQSVFIPTIGNAIFNVLGAPMSKTSAGPAAINKHPQAERCSLAGGSAACSLCASIWHCMLLGWGEGTAARKLSLVSETPDSGTASHGILEDLLDCWEADRDDADILNITEESHVPSTLHGETTEMLEDEHSPGADCDISDLFLWEDLEDQDGSFYVDTIDSAPNLRFPNGTWKHRNDHYSSTPDDRLDLAEAEAITTWQGGEFKLKSTSSQPTSLPSQLLDVPADFKSCKARRDKYLRTEEDVRLPEEEGQSVALKDDLMFEDSGDRAGINDADVRNLPSDDCEMLLL